MEENVNPMSLGILVVGGGLLDPARCIFLVKIMAGSRLFTGPNLFQGVAHTYLLIEKYIED